MVEKMTEFAKFESQIRDRLKELGVRLNEIETELDQPKSRDLGEQAIDLEDDEVLESIGIAGQKEIALLRIKVAILGIFHVHKVQGFSKIKIAPAARHARARVTTHLSKRFPISTLAWSAGRSSGSPVM